MFKAIIAMILHMTAIGRAPHTPEFERCSDNGGHVYRLYDGSYVCQE
jgi:hypothetical protein